MLAGGFIIHSLVIDTHGIDYATIEYAIGALVGILLTPDLDVDNGYIGNQIIRDRVGWIADKIWDGLWYFYRKSIKHGSELSHLPILSTIGRLAYLYLFVLVIPYAIFELVFHWWSMGSELYWWNHQLVEHYRIIIGLMGSDLIHWALDILTTEHAKQKKATFLGMALASSQCKK